MPVVVKTHAGSVSGTAVPVGPSVINEFRGIPYAEPPVGNVGDFTNLH
jgi:carboxylesterase type B